MPGGPTHVVDASALIAYFKGEAGHEVFAEVLGDDRSVLVMHCINLCEVYYDYLRSDGLTQAEAAWTKAEGILGIIEKGDAQFMKRVGRLKVDHVLGIADSVAAATAEEFGCPLITADRNDFSRVEQAGVIQVYWIR